MFFYRESESTIFAFKQMTIDFARPRHCATDTCRITRWSADKRPCVIFLREEKHDP